VRLLQRLTSVLILQLQASGGQITGAPNVLDGVTLIATNRILVKNSTNGAANGIYVVTTAGTELTVYGIELLILTQILR
jgi:hypothetical protein